MSLVLDDAGDAIDVVISDERGGHEGVEPPVVPLQRMGELEEVLLAQTTPDCLPQLVLGDRIQRGGRDDSVVVAVNDFTEKVCVRVLFPNLRQHRSPETRRHRICRVEPPGVDAAPQPVREHVHDVLLHVRALVVERNQFVVALEVAMRRLVPGEIEMEPPRGLGVRALVEGLSELRKALRNMVEDAVEHDLQAARMCSGDQGVDVLVGAEPAVDVVVVDRVVAVLLGLEDRTESDARRAELECVVEPLLDSVQPVQIRLGLTVPAVHRCAGEAERVQVPPDCVLGPLHQDSMIESRPSSPAPA